MFDFEKLKKIISKNVIEYRNLAKKMGVAYHQNKDFSKFLNDLLNKNLIATTKNKDYFIPQIEKEVQGIIRVNSKGFGFVDNGEKSVFILASNINGAFNGDEVEVKIFRDPIFKSKYQGMVSKVIKRNTTDFVGTIKRFNGNLGIVPFNKNIKGIFRFKDEKGLEINDEVKVKIIKYRYPIIVDIIKKLGKSSDLLMDVLVAIEDSNIPYEFNSKTQTEAKDIAQEVDKIDIENRKDLRDRFIVTIDGDDTKDFDDAIEVQKLENGNYKLLVHIADVTNYVKENTALDDEAKLRGTSVYLPGKVIPMLPEALSNGICSLIPNVDRLTITVEMEIDKLGETINYEIYPSIINSKFRLTYQEVNKYYSNDFSWDNKDLEKMLDYALDLSQIIRNFKNKEGYVDFEIEESKIVVDEKGKTTKIVARDRLESEMMIEDFMVRANETIAHFVEKNQLPFIYRVHDKPDIEKIKNLQGVIKALGMNVKIPYDSVPSEFAQAINQIKTTRFDNFMKIMMLRTMSKAIYSSSNIGHFGLASKSYTHFTSPIRRYPDLMVHRMLREYFFNNNKDLSNHFKEILPVISKHSSETEQKAIDLERKVSDMKKAEFYENYIGQAFDGIIVSMMKFGFFVEFPNKVDGLVHILSLTDGEYKLSEGGYALSNGKRKFTIGDKVNTTVIGVSKSEGKINLAISSLVNIKNI